MSSPDTFSVIIPVYNGDRYLDEAITSALSQSHPPSEIFVIDDGSTDQTAAVAQSHKGIHYLHQKNQGTGAARNRGLEMATGHYLAFLDSDDVWTPNKLALQLSAFRRKSQPEILFGHVEQFISPELEETLRDKVACPKEAMPGKIPSSMVVARPAFDRVGLFSEDSEIGEFTDWYLRSREADLREEILPEVITHRRIHDQNQGIRHKDSRNDYLSALRASLKRRRAKE